MGDKELLINYIFIAYCEKGKTTPVRSWVQHFDDLSDASRDVIMDSLQFVLETGSGEKKVRVVETDGSTLEIEHPDESIRAMRVTDIFKKIIDNIGEQDKTFQGILKKYGNIFAMKYLRADYSRTRAIIVVPFTYNGERFVGVIATDILGEDKIPCINEQEGKLADTIIKNALLADRKRKGDRYEYRASKMCIYPSYDYGAIDKEKMKIYERTRSDYVLKAFELRQVPPDERQKEAVYNIIKRLVKDEDDSITISKKLRMMSKELEEKGVLLKGDIAELLGIEESDVQELLDEAYGGKYTQMISSKKNLEEISIAILTAFVDIKFKLRALLENKIYVVKIDDRIGLLITDLGSDLESVTVNVLGANKKDNLSSIVREENVKRIRIL